MKIIFLDVDGVLNNWHTRQMTPCGFIGVEEDKAKILRRAVAAADASIVLSSTWRKFPELVDHLWDVLGESMKSRWIGSTPEMQAERGVEIHSWLSSHPEVEKFVIVDDDADMVHLVPHLVQTDNQFGLTEEDADRIIEHLTSAPLPQQLRQPPVPTLAC